MNSAWTIEDAQSQLPRLIDTAVTDGPQMIMRDDKTVVVVVASDEWDDIQTRDSDAAVFGNRPNDGRHMQIGNLKNFVCG